MYAGGFVGSADSLSDWLTPKIEEWTDAVRTLSRVARRYPQTAYCALTRSLQTEWTYLQRVVPESGPAFKPVEDAIQKEFLPALFGGPPPVRELTSLPVNMAGLGIPDPVTSASTHFSTSVSMTEEISTSLIDGTELDAIGFGLLSKNLLRNLKREHRSSLLTNLESLLTQADPQEERRLKRNRMTGCWLTTAPSTDFGTALSALEFRDALRLRFGLTPLDLPQMCDGCPNSRFTVGHALQCKRGGLIRARHEDVAAEWSSLCAQALTPSAVADEPTIPTVNNANSPARTALRGDVSAHGFWSRGTTTVFDICVTDTDAHSHRNRDPLSILRRQEKEKKDKYNEACLEAHQHFTLLVYLVDGLEGSEAEAARKRLASRLAAKWNRQYSQVCSVVRSRLSFTLIRATNRCLRGSRTPNRQPQSLDWLQRSGMRLYMGLC